MGITPAYAGKSGKPPQGGAPPWDHPRVCGEKAPGPVAVGVLTGSPPRMRGKAHDIEVLKDALRITPAYAGKRALDRCRGLW